MAHIPERRSLRRRLRPYFTVFDLPLTLILAVLVTISMVTMSSAGADFPDRVEHQIRNFLLSFAVMWIAANIAPQTLMRLAVPIYTIGVALLLAVAMFGLIKKGARRWLHIGVIDIQPSEIMKIGVPLMLAWYFQTRAQVAGWKNYLAAGALLMIPVAFIMKQPDLGTSLLVASSGLYVIFLAGLSWKAIAAVSVLGLAGLPVGWSMMHDYQRERVMTLIDPTSDPLGKGFHIIQSTIAVGSGGFWGRGWTAGTQTHLEFIPERTTDFIFAVYAEEFGFFGNMILLLVYLMLIARGLVIASRAASEFGRLLAGAITLIFFTYAFVNMGMVSGILPVVGVPLPLMSYGGTAMVTLGLGAGLLMGIQRNRKLVQT